MKHIKSYNESVRQYLKPKSNEEILDKLSKLDDNKKIETIIKYRLDYLLLPRNRKGLCVYNGNLSCYNKNLTKLPDNLIVKGNLICSNNQLIKLPENLIIEGDLWCSDNNLTELPKNLIINGSLYCHRNKITELPDNLVVKNRLWCNTLPENIKKPKGVNSISI